MSGRPPGTPPRLLTIAGSDSGGGAGIQADLKTFAAHGGYGMSAITAITAQNTLEVTAVHALPPELVAAQIDAVFADIGVDAVKVGMLAEAAIVEAVAERLHAWAGPPVVVDPVMVSKSGAALLRDDAVAALRERLIPLATVVTPNLPEGARLLGEPIAADQQEASARRLAALGPAVLLKGGHGEGEELVDVLVYAGRMWRFSHRRLAISSTHGTGCTLASAIAARLGRGDALEEAVGGALAYLQRALRAAFPLGGGRGPVRHDVAADTVGGET
ncbi:MAG TPA: bifunctional hydroxymethylpyrimidine kinase/phosphomethylpyrimidine kinase [Thermoanaerobaculia bacterium]|nr:bifunctional hydroxymethylpyrimidine kinase/phosphomethylpyrimidine kinase [Thermoanaerobaculia bacterium]